MPYIFPTQEELAPLVEELGLEVEDLERLTVYVGLMAYCDDDTDKVQYIKDNLAKWADWEQETYYGWHANTADFAEYYYENYTEDPIPNWIVPDWEASWRRNLRHDFHYDEDSGHVWAEVY